MENKHQNDVLKAVTSPPDLSASSNILAYMERCDAIKLKTNQQLADLLIDADFYGKLVSFEPDCILMNEVITRLLNGQIPEHWEYNEQRGEL